MKQLHILFFGLLCLLLASCGADSAETPFPTNIPAPTDTPESTDTSVPADTPRPTRVSDDGQGIGMEPTDIPTPTNTPAPTKPSTPTATPTHPPVGAILPLTATKLGDTYRTLAGQLALTLPDGWELTEVDERTSTLTRADASDFMVRISLDPIENQIDQSDLINEPIVPWMYALGKSITLRYLSDAGKRKMVLYTFEDDPLAVNSDELQLSIAIEAIGADGDISAETISQTDAIVASLWLPELDQPVAMEAADVSAEIYYSSTVTSTDGAWLAEAISFAPELVNAEIGLSRHRQLFTVERIDGSQRWVARDVYEGWGIGVGYYTPLRWTDEMLYFTYRPIPGGCGSADGSDLWSIDLTTGFVSQLASSQGIHVALSADAERFAYNINEGFSIFDMRRQQIVDYDIGLEGRYTVDSIEWMADGDRLTLLLLPNDGMCGMSGDHLTAEVSLTDAVFEIVAVESGEGN